MILETAPDKLEAIKINFEEMETVKYNKISEDSEEKNYRFRQYLEALLIDKRITESEHNEFVYVFHPDPESAAKPMTDEDADELITLIKKFNPKIEEIPEIRKVPEVEIPEAPVKEKKKRKKRRTKAEMAAARAKEK